METAPPALTERFLAAVALAQEVHGEQRRTGTEIPYLSNASARTSSDGVTVRPSIGAG